MFSPARREGRHSSWLFLGTLLPLGLWCLTPSGCQINSSRAVTERPRSLCFFRSFSTNVGQLKSYSFLTSPLYPTIRVNRQAHLTVLLLKKQSMCPHAWCGKYGIFFYTSDPKETALGNIVMFQLLGKQQNDSKWDHVSASPACDSLCPGRKQLKNQCEKFYFLSNLGLGSCYWNSEDMRQRIPSYILVIFLYYKGQTHGTGLRRPTSSV